MTDLGTILQTGLAGSYTIERELGRGGMAMVFLARDLKHDRLVALKVLDPELAASVGSERFLREIRVAARLQHPHILTVHDSGEVAATGGGPALLWYTMPYVEGESLRDRLSREGQLPVAEAVTIAREAADALGHAHEHGIIHRDIKPENLLLAGGHVAVADFGIARALGSEAQQLTGTGLAVGTPAYMSPEQATGDAAVDARADVYALGCVLYEMLAGEPPWTGPTPMQVITRAMTEPYRPLHTVRSAVPPAVERVVATALARVPADRFANGTGMARALDAAVVTPTAMPTIDAVVPDQPQPRRSRWPMVAAITALALLLLLVLFYLPSRDNRGTVLGDNLVAVAPFELVSSDADLAVWSDGMVDVLARYFDGAGTLRAVAPTRAIRAWDGRADRESAGRFGRKMGARYVVYGQVIGGADSVRLTASLLDLSDSTEMATRDWRGAAARMDRLADSLATMFLDVLGRTRELGQVRRDPLGTSDPLAVREFLSGMRDLRRASYASAADHFTRSIAHDTGFVLGRLYGSHARGWLTAANDSIAIRLRLEAGARNRGLTRRDSLMVLADSLAAAQYLRFDSGLGPDFTRAARMAQVMDTALASYPDDPDVIYRITDENYHLNLLGKSQRWHYQNFRRATALDPQSALAFEHAVELSPMFEPPDTTLALVRNMLAVPGLPDEKRQALRMVEFFFDPSVPVAAKQTAMDTASADLMRRAQRFTEWTVDTLGLMLARTRARRFPEAPGVPELLVEQLLYHGRLSEAVSALERVRSPNQRRYLARELASLDALPVARFDSLNDAGWDSPSPFGPLTGLSIWVATGDTARLGRLQRRVDSVAGAAPPEVRQELEPAADFIRAMLSLARGDSTAARRRTPRIENAPLGLQAETPFGLLPAELTLAFDPEDRAWALLQSRQSGAPEPDAVIWRLYRARLAEKRGERAIAIDNYGFVARLWRDAEEPLAGLAREAREALVRLNAEPRTR